MRQRRSARQAAAGLVLVLGGVGLVVDLGPATATDAPRAAAQTCKRPGHGFVPNRASIPAIGRTVKVIQVKRKKNNKVGAGPTTTAGKWLMAMDPEIKPGRHKGTVKLSGHTWPDGSALGNAMLNNLWEGDGIVLKGKNGKQACYRITKRQSYPRDKAPRQAMRSTGPERVVIVSCSGKRLGPGNWTRRTLWYASPAVPPRPPKPAPSTSPTPDSGSDPGLFGILGVL